MRGFTAPSGGEWSFGTSVDLIVRPSGGWFAIGSDKVYFPPNSICDPATSSYGPTEWDAPCQPISRPIRIHATYDRGREWVAFAPALRFVPTDDPKQFVSLYVYSPTFAMNDASGVETDYRLEWLPLPTAPGVDEGRDDRTQHTRKDGKQALVYRRVKHFSGYQVVSGFAAEALDF
jgi:hypothetical protein